MEDILKHELTHQAQLCHASGTTGMLCCDTLRYMQS